MVMAAPVVLSPFPAFAQAPVSPAIPTVRVNDAAELAHRIAVATVQPGKVLADSVANFERQFDGGAQRSMAGRTMTPAQTTRLARLKVIGRAELERQLRADAVPTSIALVEDEYRNNYTDAELADIAAFWTSPAGLALTAEAQKAGLAGRSITPPTIFMSVYAQYFATPAGRKENARRTLAQARMVTAMTAAIQRAMTKVDAAMTAAAARP